MVLADFLKNGNQQDCRRGSKQNRRTKPLLDWCCSERERISYIKVEKPKTIPDYINIGTN